MKALRNWPSVSRAGFATAALCHAFLRKFRRACRGDLGSDKDDLSDVDGKGRKAPCPRSFHPPTRPEEALQASDWARRDGGHRADKDDLADAPRTRSPALVMLPAASTKFACDKMPGWARSITLLHRDGGPPGPYSYFRT